MLADSYKTFNLIALRVSDVTFTINMLSFICVAFLYQLLPALLVGVDVHILLIMTFYLPPRPRKIKGTLVTRLCIN